jgi:4-hydroxy-2-oxoheptanedioate aldolase
MTAQGNPFKRALAAGEKQIGLWSSLCSPISAEVLAGAGFDWIVVDTEHAPNETFSVMTQLQAMGGGSATPVVRPAWNDAVMIKRFLDVGATAFLVPMVQSAGEARQAVAATRYPPAGIRGVASATRANAYGRGRDYFQRADKDICVLVQVETAPALDRLEEIAAVEGVDGVFIGPSDLSAALGHIGNANHPDVQKAILAVPARCAKAGKPAGILTAAEADAQRYVDAGFRFVAVGSDISILVRGSDALVQRFKKS